MEGNGCWSIGGSLIVAFPPDEILESVGLDKVFAWDLTKMNDGILSAILDDDDVYTVPPKTFNQIADHIEENL